MSQEYLDRYLLRRHLAIAEELLQDALKKRGTPDYDPETVKELKAVIREYKHKLRNDG